MTVDTRESLPYWQVNVPTEHRTKECPDFLAHVTEKDRGILSTKDEDYRRSTWEEVKNITANNDLASFRRVPSDLRRYLEFKTAIIKKYGSILAFVQHERLRWPNIDPWSDTPFSNPSDYKILWNDWPYGIDKDIAHLVIWTKFALDVEPETGDITPHVRSMLESFVCRTFCSPREQRGLDRSQVIWFKNWASLKSVDAIEHFHVMLYKAPRPFIDELTNGDQPLAEKIQAEDVPVEDTLSSGGVVA